MGRPKKVKPEEAAAEQPVTPAPSEEKIQVLVAAEREYLDRVKPSAQPEGYKLTSGNFRKDC